MKKFRTSFSGYNKQDVNDFVSEVISEYEKLLDKLKKSTLDIQSLNAEVEKYKNLEKSLHETIIIAQEASMNAQKNAISEGKLIIEDAKKNASRIVNNSLIKAQNIERDAEELKRRVASYKRKFISLVESHLDDVDKFDERF